MARIVTARIGLIYRVTLSGRLGATDLHRLESACGSALQQKHLPLELDISRVTSVDDVARTFLEKLQARGAQIHASSS